MILTSELANAIIDRAMAGIHHNVNVISNDGIIIASGDKSRIGSSHEVGLGICAAVSPPSLSASFICRKLKG
ncbi:MAG: hypothetical protein IAB19_01850 [Proteobacteria bacterium]|uniref:Putative sugar diacid recognition domain-containing protein n=1 Tax=Candidatus Avisuccinivibrio stercorigallinarum TaxID=2840704 RepID=A0A9D9DB46_9GAMM|nr:hypothetical protein [Candidatus Avisuccinivibrio stercorigallinarum]